jgi:D-alanyl-D-alanine dipeptidase
MKQALIRILFFILLVTPLCMPFAGCEKSEKPAEIPEYENAGFVLITDVVPEAILEIRYYSTYNFVGERIHAYEAPVAYLTKEAAQALKNVSDDLMAQGYRIKIYDAYRPQTAVDHFKSWAEDLDATEMKPYFYPEVDKSQLFEQGYIAAKSGHSRGSTVDLTIVDMATGMEVDMGGGFDYFGELSHPGYTATLTQEQIDNRMILRKAMMDNGFKPLEEEWWHFTLVDEPYPDTYFDFPVEMPDR